MRRLSGSIFRTLGLIWSPTVKHVRGMLNAAPGNLPDMQQAVDAAEIDESAIVGEAADGAR